LHVPSLSVNNVWDLPLWSWRQYVDWQDEHVARYRKLAEKGVLCVHC
jgi:hypothetical protein